MCLGCVAGFACCLCVGLRVVVGQMKLVDDFVCCDTYFSGHITFITLYLCLLGLVGLWIWWFLGFGFLVAVLVVVFV